MVCKIPQNRKNCVINKIKNNNPRTLFITPRPNRLYYIIFPSSRKILEIETYGRTDKKKRRKTTPTLH